ncbi:MAG TPA: amidohydrolase family protein [Xanthobacteraceae bacterium]
MRERQSRISLRSIRATALASLVKVAPVSQILFGTDYPYRTSADHVKGVDEFFTSEADRRAITRENALALIPRLKAG